MREMKRDHNFWIRSLVIWSLQIEFVIAMFSPLDDQTFKIIVLAGIIWLLYESGPTWPGGGDGGGGDG